MSAIAMAVSVILSFTLPLLIPLFGGGASRNNATNDADARPQVPDFVLPSTDGLDIRLADAAASHSAIVILFHRGVDCSVCRDQVAEIAASYTQLRQQGTEVLVISTETREDAIRMAEYTRAEFPVLYDIHGIVSSGYQVVEQLESSFTTAIFIVDRDLRLIGLPVGTSGPQVLPVEVLLDIIRQFNGSAAVPS